MSREKPQQKRKYDSSRRKAQARETKLRITEAARSLFLEHGYVGTTIEAIAVDARVSRETIYGIFQNKQNILTFLLDISVGGDDLPGLPGIVAQKTGGGKFRRAEEFRLFLLAW